MKKWQLVVAIILLLLTGSQILAAPSWQKYTQPHFSINFYPIYPLLIGKKTYVRIKTSLNAKKIVLGLENSSLITMDKKENYWGTELLVSDKFKEGWNRLKLYIYYEESETVREVASENIWQKIMMWIKREKYPKAKVVKKKKIKLLERSMWYRVYHPERPPEIFEILSVPAEPTPELPLGEVLKLKEEEKIKMPITMTEEVVSITTEEVEGLTVKGNKTLTFSIKTLEGTKEGFVPGVMREEALRLNISGKIEGTEIDANLFSTSSGGTAGTLQKEEKVSCRLKRGGTELYFGDFTASMDNLEFAKLDKSLSGLRLTGDYDLPAPRADLVLRTRSEGALRDEAGRQGRWGFKIIGSSPQGESKTWKSYGDGTQGPYYLGFTPIVVDSERVHVDDVLQKRGDDYELNYNTGALTFKKRTILNEEIIQVDFDYRETTYQHSTYALRTKGKLSDSLELGVTYLNDSDNLEGAETIKGETGVSPVSHFVIGADGKLDLGDILKAESEFAYSEKDLDVLSEGSKEVGKAAKIKTLSSLGPLSLSAKFKRIGSKFQSIGDVSPKQDLWEYGGVLAYRPNQIFFAECGLDSQKYVWQDTPYSIETQTAKTKVSPKRWPSLAYRFFKEELSNDLVSQASINRKTVRNSGETAYKFGFLRSSLKLSHEERLDRTPSEEVTIYRIANFGLSTIGLEKITASGNIELKETEEPTGLKPYTKTYNLNISATPTKNYFLSAGVNYIDDSKEGTTNVTDLSYKAQPIKVFKTDGKYTIASIMEDFAGTKEAVSKQTGSFKFTLRPIRQVRLRYLHKPNFTLIRRTNSLSYNNAINQTEFMWAPVRQLSLGTTLKTESTMNIDKTDPTLSRRKDTENKKSTILSLKLAPWKILSLELNFTAEDKEGESLNTSDLSYTQNTGVTRRFDAMAKTSLSEKFSIDSKYSYTKSDEGTGEATSNTKNTMSQTESLKGILDINDNWTLSAGGTYTQTIDYLKDINPETYTISPSLGFIYKLGSNLRIDGDYTYSKSYQGATTEKIVYSVKTKWILNEYVYLTLRGEQEISRAPDYKTSEILGNMEINL